MNNPFEVVEGAGGIGSGRVLNLTDEEKKERRKQQIRNAQRRYREAHRDKYNEYMKKLYRGLKKDDEPSNVDLENWKQRNKEAMIRYLAKKKRETEIIKMDRIQKREIKKDVRNKILKEKKEQTSKNNESIKNEIKNLKRVAGNEDRINELKSKIVRLSNVKLDNNDKNRIEELVMNEEKLKGSKIEIPDYTDEFKSRFTEEFFKEDKNQMLKPNYIFESDASTGYEPSDYEKYFGSKTEPSERKKVSRDIKKRITKPPKETPVVIEDVFKPTVIPEVVKEKPKQKSVRDFEGKTFKGYTFTEEDVDKISSYLEGKSKELKDKVMSNPFTFNEVLKSIKKKEGR